MPVVPIAFGFATPSSTRIPSSVWKSRASTRVSAVWM
jgi:hypothetical protein